MNLESPQLEIFGVYDRGIPNAERIVLRANRAVDLTNYAVLLGFDQNNSVFPFTDNFLWLGAKTLSVPSWVFIYTGQGKESVSQEIHTKDPVHALYWEKPTIILSNPQIVPVLVQLANVIIGNTPAKTVADLTSPTPDVTGIIEKAIQKYLEDQTNKTVSSKP